MPPFLSATSRIGTSARGLRATSAGFVTLAVLLCAPEARAYHTEVDAAASAQYYTLESPYGDPQLRRRRFTTMLGMSLYDMLLNLDGSTRAATLIRRA